MLTEPFGIQSTASVRKTNIPTGNDYGHESSYNEEPPHKKSSAHNESFDLKVLLYLTLIYGFFEIIIIYGKYDFLNLIVLTCLLSIYLMNFFDRAYIRLTLALIITSLILDIVWLCLYAKSKWNVSTVSNDSLHEKGFLRFIVFFTVVLMIIKLAMAIILFKYRNAQTEEKYSVSVGLMTILISGNRSNPFSK